MNEKWDVVIQELERLSQLAGVALPADFKFKAGQPAGRMQADPVLRNGLLLDRLVWFLQDVNGMLALPGTSKEPVKRDGKTGEKEITRGRR